MVGGCAIRVPRMTGCRCPARRPIRAMSQPLAPLATPRANRRGRSRRTIHRSRCDRPPSAREPRSRRRPPPVYPSHERRLQHATPGRHGRSRRRPSEPCPGHPPARSRHGRGSRFGRLRRPRSRRRTTAPPRPTPLRARQADRCRSVPASPQRGRRRAADRRAVATRAQRLELETVGTTHRPPSPPPCAKPHAATSCRSGPGASTAGRPRS